MEAIGKKTIGQRIRSRFKRTNAVRIVMFSSGCMRRP